MKDFETTRRNDKRATKWKELVERPTGRESIESNIYSVDCLKDMISHAEESEYKEVTFKIYDNGNVAFVFENEEIEIAETAKIN